MENRGFFSGGVSSGIYAKFLSLGDSFLLSERWGSQSQDAWSQRVPRVGVIGPDQS